MNSTVKTIPTLYTWAGSNNELEKLTKCFYDKVSRDEIPQGAFANMAAHHAQPAVHFTGEEFGRPRSL
jgi:truncated hemoglobin YjbI